MTGTEENTRTSATAAQAALPAPEVVAAALALAKAGRWQRAASLLDAAAVTDAGARVALTLAAAEVALDSDWFAGTRHAPDRLRAAERACADADHDRRSAWDLAFLRLRQEYGDQIRGAAGPVLGPQGKDPAVLADLRRRADDLCDEAADDVRRGWAQMYRGLIADNLFAERTAAPASYEAALLAGDGADDLLAREALRHLGDHDHDDGRPERALARWNRATELGARAGAVPGTLSQQLLLAVLARDRGDHAGAAALAGEIARWAAALGAAGIAAQATAFLAGADPTAPPADVR